MVKHTYDHLLDETGFISIERRDFALLMCSIHSQSVEESSNISHMEELLGISRYINRFMKPPPPPEI